MVCFRYRIKEGIKKGDNMKDLIHKLALEYTKENNLKPLELINKAVLNEDKAVIIAEAYSQGKEDLSDKETLKAYREFKRELIKQYRLIKQYIKIEFTEENPYTTSKAMFQDINENKRVKIFLGGENHKLLKGINKIFRAVHDIFGHYINENSFSPNGEYCAFLHHRQLFSKEAQKALFTETIAQICFYKVNKQYATQKAMILNNCLRMV